MRKFQAKIVTYFYVNLILILANARDWPLRTSKSAKFFVVGMFIGYMNAKPKIKIKIHERSRREIKKRNGIFYRWAVTIPFSAKYTYIKKKKYIYIYVYILWAPCAHYYLLTFLIECKCFFQLPNRGLVQHVSRAPAILTAISYGVTLLPYVLWLLQMVEQKFYSLN